MFFYFFSLFVMKPAEKKRVRNEQKVEISETHHETVGRQRAEINVLWLAKTCDAQVLYLNAAFGETLLRGWNCYPLQLIFHETG